MKCHVLISVFAVAGASMAAGPSIEEGSVSFHQSHERLVTIAYKLLDAPAVVTVDIQTNAGNNVWVSIGAGNFTSIAGDVNRLVQPDADQPKSVIWNPRADLPEFRLSGKDVARAVVTAWSVQTPPDYMVIDVTKNVAADASADNVRYYTCVEALPDCGLVNDVYRKGKIVMRRIPATGVTWRMGSPVGEYARNVNEVPHLVTLTNDYYMGIYEYTSAQSNRANGDAAPGDSMMPQWKYSYDEFRGSVSDGIDWPKTGHTVKGSSHLGILRARTGIPTFDIPTEAEWEFACRAGTETGWPNGENASTVDVLKTFAVIFSSSSGSRMNVGTRLPNRWGLYDMIGNSGEYCLDWFGDYNVADEVAPKGPESGTTRVRRGGYCELGGIADGFSSAARASRSPSQFYTNFGFRLVCAAVAVR